MSRKRKVPTYPKRVKKIIKKRDLNRCFMCQSTSNLTIAHTFVWRKDGGRPVVENGITLCRTCHDKMDFGIGVTRQEQIDMLKLCKKYLDFTYMKWYDEEDLTFPDYQKRLIKKRR